MPTKQIDLLRGTLDLLVLKALALGPPHGLGVSRRIEQMTKGAFQVKPRSLFPSLHRHGGGRMARVFVGRVGE